MCDRDTTTSWLQIGRVAKDQLQHNDQSGIPLNDVAQNLKRIRERISETARSCGRASEDITLLAVSKTFPVEVLSQAIAAGQFLFGENRVQEAEAKIRVLRGDSRLGWHLVGHLQTNKARKAAELFDVIHSLDSLRLAVKLSEAGLDRKKPVSVLLQIDLGEEATKFGVERNQVGSIMSALGGLRGIQLNGLMTIPPYFADPERSRPFFTELRRIGDSLEREEPGSLGQRHLSMGMSHDFEIAIQEGATIVRVGTAVFGERNHA
jgi:pyridoxal phosphate enzyme (YggS family)